MRGVAPAAMIVLALTCLLTVALAAETTNPTTDGSAVGALIIEELKQKIADEKYDAVKLTAIDLGIPTQPAAHLLGVDPATVQKASNVRELLLAAINSTDQRGNLQQGFAFAVTHWRLTRFRGTAEKRFRDDLARDVEYSIAAVKGSSGDDPSAKLAMGLSWPYTDDTRPFRDIGDVRDYFTAVGKATSAEAAALLTDVLNLQKKVGGTPVGSYKKDENGDTLVSLDELWDELGAMTDFLNYPGLAKGEKAAYEAQYEGLWNRYGELWVAERERQLKKRQEDRWNAHTLSFAGGLAWVSPSGLSSDFRSDRYGVWVRGSVPHGSRGQVLYALSYRDRETVPDPSNEGEFIRRNVWSVGGRYVLGGPTHGVSAEVSYGIENPEEGDSERVRTYLLGWEQRITANQWLQLSVGREGERSTGNETLFGLSYNIGLGNKAQIRGQRPKSELSAEEGNT